MIGGQTIAADLPAAPSGSCPSPSAALLKHFGERKSSAENREDARIQVFFCGGPPLTFVCSVSTEQGKVLKVLHTSEGVFIISQYSLFHNEGPVLNMVVDSQKVSLPLEFCVNL